MFRFSTRNAVPTSRSGRRPPPNYFSRRVQFQVGVLVFLFMTVLMLMAEARKPENWEWMWKLERRGATNGDESFSPTEGPPDGTGDGGGAIDTRVADVAAPAAVPPGEPRVMGTSSPSPLDWQQASNDRSLDVAVLHGWTSVWSLLSPPQRDLLREGLRRQRRGARASQADAVGWAALVAELDRRWEAYQHHAATALAHVPYALTPEQRQQASDVLAALEARWRSELEALQAAGASAPTSAAQAAKLDTLQQVLDQRAWQAVEDDTVLRSADREAWLRCWEQVDAMAAAHASAAAQRVTFVQLFSQPHAYRGRLVQVSGTARHGYRAASRDPQGPGREYYILWLRPSDGSNAPIAVYARELPAGFPPLPARVAGQDGGELRDDVVVTGVFFKRWLYASRDGLRTAPLVLGRITHWTPVAPDVEMTQTRPIGLWQAMGLVLAAAALGLGMARIATRSNRRPRRTADPLASAPHRLPAFDSTAVQPAVGDRLNQLASEERHEM